ncbi:MAG: exodeoxyribonuclease VII small subunit [Bacteroidaceae bacterium]|nr:exodeoxyribonuclease VII small subunit [Bacteroidaceae bacterium]
MMNKIETYNDAIKRLEEIIAQVNAGAVDIDMLTANLREAQELINFCRNKLYKVDEEVKALLSSIADETAE